jgi:hypothetical protein
MTKPRKVWVCTRCGAEFVNRAKLPPRGWRVDGETITCRDCADGDAVAIGLGLDHLTDIRTAGEPDPSTANLIRNGAERDLADPDHARRAA